MNWVFNFETGETRDEYIARCGTDRCKYCRKDVPKDWGLRFCDGTFMCVRCEEMREEARRDGGLC